ncbi:DNA gyrase subunit B [compost metagenome]
MELAEARNNVGVYLGDSQGEYDPHPLLWSVIENSLLEHQAGYCNEISLVLHKDNSITVADNGRGIPTQALPHSNKTPIQTILTDLGPDNTSVSMVAPGGLKGINMTVVNALSQQLFVIVRREGKVFRQDFKHGIPQTELLVIGVTKETGTSVSFTPDPDIFGSSFDKAVLKHHIQELSTNYPDLKIDIFD